jgi:hypothetical protein
MNHRAVKHLLEEYVALTLSPEKTWEIEQHLDGCPRCRETVRLIRMTRGIVLASRLNVECLPRPRFSDSVLAAIEQQKETYFFWSPVRLLALRAIPLMAVVALILSAVAYTQLAPALSAQNSDPYALESYLDFPFSWDQERLMFSNASAPGSEQTQSPEDPSHSNPPGSGR